MAQTQEKHKVRWISHRGYRPAALENSLAAFLEAQALGFTCFETDLRVTKDGHLVLCHDRSLARLGGPASAVDLLTRAEAERLELSGGQRLLFFDEFMEHFAGQNWVFDVKPETGEQVVAGLGRWVRARKAEEWFFAHARFLFWQRRQQQLLAAQWPSAEFLARQDECWRAGLAILAKAPRLGGIVARKAYALPVRLGRLELFRPPIVEAYHQQGAKVIAYLPATPEETAAALAAGVDEVLTDFARQP